MTDEEDSKSRDASGVYLAVVGGLLLVICAALTVLWMSERSRRVSAEQHAARLQQQIGLIFESSLQMPPQPASQPSRE